MRVGGKFHAPAALPPGNRPGTHCIGSSFYNQCECFISVSQVQAYFMYSIEHSFGPILCFSKFCLEFCLLMAISKKCTETQ
jgi:hypothetical protein